MKNDHEKTLKKLQQLAQESRERSEQVDSAIEQKEKKKFELTPEYIEEMGNFWKRFHQGYNYFDHVKNAKFVPTLALPQDLPYEQLSKPTNDKMNFGKYFVNPETQNLDFETMKPFIPDLSSMYEERTWKIFDHVVKEYGDKYYIPGFEYQKWLKENPDKIPLELKDDKKYFVSPGSLHCSFDGHWQALMGKVDTSKQSWDCRVEDPYDQWHSGDRIILLPKS